MSKFGGAAASSRHANLAAVTIEPCHTTRLAAAMRDEEVIVSMLVIDGLHGAALPFVQGSGVWT